MMTPKRRQPVGAIVLATLGILVILTGLGLHWWAEAHGQKHRLEWLPQLIGSAIAFAGFYRMNPKRAKDGGSFILDAGDRIVGWVRPGGRRATDPPVVTPAVPIGDAPPAPDIPPTGGFPPSQGGE